MRARVRHRSLKTSNAALKAVQFFGGSAVSHVESIQLQRTNANPKAHGVLTNPIKGTPPQHTCTLRADQPPAGVGLWAFAVGPRPLLGSWRISRPSSGPRRPRGCSECTIISSLHPRL